MKINLNYKWLLAFFALFSLLTVAALLYLQNTQQQQFAETEDTLTEHEIELQLLGVMIQAARERSLLILRMTYEEDEFARQDLIDNFYEQASLFITSRDKFESMTFMQLPEKQLYLRETLKYVEITSALLGEALTLMNSGLAQQAAHMVVQEILPNQDIIIRRLENLQTSIRSHSSETISTGRELTELHSERFFLSIIWILFLIASGLLLLSSKFRFDEKQLDETRRFNDSILNNAFDAILILDNTGRISRFNLAAEQLLGYSRENLLGQNLQLLAPNHTFKLNKEGTAHQFQGNTETDLLRQDGHHIPAAISISDTGINDHQRFTCIIHDLTQIRQAQTELVQQKNAMDQHSIVSITDTSGNITYVNDRFCEMSGYKREELLGQNHRIVNSGQNTKNYWESFYATLFSGKTWHHEICNRHKNGSLYWLNTTIVPFTDSEGQLNNFVSISSDITERVKAEKILTEHQEALEGIIAERTRELTHAKEVAETANNSKSLFLANMSHELRTPMHAISSFCHLATKANANRATEKVESFLQRISESAERLTRVLNDLLDLSKMEAGKMEYHFTALNLMDIVRNVSLELGVLAQKKQVKIQLPDKPDNLPAEIDSDRITQVVHNLLSNAIKFTPDGKAIDLQCELLEDASEFYRLHNADLPESDSFIRFTVSDQGPGIPEDELDSIFEHFVQSSKTSTGAGGTGLGLPISREIILQHKGVVFAQNNPETGVTFSFIIPRQHGKG